jgi:hypothetical protein
MMRTVAETMVECVFEEIVERYIKGKWFDPGEAERLQRTFEFARAHNTSGRDFDAELQLIRELIGEDPFERDFLSWLWK